jgi:hypothetical protein
MRRAPPLAPTPAAPAPVVDPTRLLRGGDQRVTELMRVYARRTRPGERVTLAGWYRLRPLLHPGTRGTGAPEWRPRWTGGRLLGGAASAALILLVAVAARPPGRTTKDPLPHSTPAGDSEGRRAVGPGGSSGWGELGAGGAEGSSGAHAGAETAINDGYPATPPPRAG